LLIEKSRQKAISQVKSALNNLFWQIGNSADYGRNFELRNLRRMMQFAEQIPQ
jgi:hypothetical protein